jgi:hypothetical protein
VPSDSDSALKQLSVAVALVSALPFVLALAIVVPFGSSAVQWVTVRRYLRKHRGSVHLFATRRRGWGPFLENNVLPGVSSTIHVHWDARNIPRDLAHLCGFTGHSRPYLVVLDSTRPTAFDLHTLLLPLKDEAKKDEAVAIRVSEAVRAAGFPGFAGEGHGE